MDFWIFVIELFEPNRFSPEFLMSNATATRPNEWTKRYKKKIGKFFLIPPRYNQI